MAYKANRNDDDKEKQATEKVGKLATRGALDYATGGNYENFRNKPVVGKLAKKLEEQGGKNLSKSKNSKLIGKAAKNLDDAGVLDGVEKAADSFSGNMGKNNKNQIPNTNQNGKNSNNNIKNGVKNGLSNWMNNRGKSSLDEETLEEDPSKQNISYNGLNFSKIIEFLKKNPSLIGPILIVVFVFFIIFAFIVITASLDEKESNNPECELTENADTSTKRGARFTTYTGTSLGGTLGDVDRYVQEGTIFYEKGNAMWKGGSKSKINGKTYGEFGKNYMIVATATKYIIGNCVNSSCSYRWQKDDNIKYYEYGDTFTISISFDGGKTYNNYNAIVLDSCGACMEWSLTYPKNGLYAPKKQMEIDRCKKAEGYKIDIYRRNSDYKIPADMGYIMDGSSSNTCVGQVDLGNLVTGISDTKLLQDKSLKEIYGGEAGVKSLNQEIKNNVDKYGSGTGKGVSAAAITLINSLKKKGYRLPYYWAGGHGAISNGAKLSWGSPTSSSCSRYGTCYYYDSLDCSGFVSWSIRNGGCTNFTAHSSSGFGSLGKAESSEEAKPGDILVKAGSHVTLVVQNNNGKIILAESSGGTGGVHFTDYATSSYKSYTFRDMSGFYNSSSCK